MRLNPMTPAGRKTSGRYTPTSAESRAARAPGRTGTRSGGAAPPSGGAAPRSGGATATKSRPSIAGPGATATKSRPSTARPGATAPSHDRTIRRRPAPNAPRRVSGPARPKPDPVPGAGRRRREAAGSPASARFDSVTKRASAYLRRLPDHKLIDRLVRGRAWIPVLGVMLAGIVAMQVEVLKLGASVGRSVESSTALSTRNELLRASVASLSDQGRIERLAAGMGMIMPPPGSTGFLSQSADGSLKQAIANIHAPDASTFLSSTASNGSVATASIMSPDGSISGGSGSTDSSTGETSASAVSPGTAGTSSSSGEQQVAAPTQSTSDQGVADQTSTNQSTPEQSAPVGSTPTQSAPTQSAPTQAAPTQATQDQTAAPDASTDGGASAQPSTPVGG